MSDKRRAPTHAGFSLLEVLVALAIAAVLLTILVDTLANANQAGRKTRVRAELANAGAIVNQQLRQELALAGLGVPSGLNVSTGAVDQFGSVVVVASPTEVGILGDFPRPDANFNTFGLLDDRPASGGNDHHVSWHTENNGSCMPSNPAGCQTGQTSFFFPGEDGCNSQGAAETPDRTCPWGLRRLRNAEPFQVVAGNKQWFSATNNPTLTVHDHGFNGIFAIHTGNNFPASWTNNSASSLPNGGSGQGWVTTLDRIFYRHNAANRTIERIQCWGLPKPANALWPPATATTAGATPCAAPFEGMAAFEVVARNVDSLTFSYFDAANAAVTTINTAAKKRSVRRIEYAMVFSKSVSGQIVQHEAVGGTFISAPF